MMFLIAFAALKLTSSEPEKITVDYNTVTLISNDDTWYYEGNIGRSSSSKGLDFTCYIRPSSNSRFVQIKGMPIKPFSEIQQSEWKYGLLRQDLMAIKYLVEHATEFDFTKIISPAARKDIAGIGASWIQIGQYQYIQSPRKIEESVYEVWSLDIYTSSILSYATYEDYRISSLKLITEIDIQKKRTRFCEMIASGNNVVLATRPSGHCTDWNRVAPDTDGEVFYNRILVLIDSSEVQAKKLKVK